MTDPVTVGALVASAIAMSGEASVKGFIGEAAKDAYKALKNRVALWAGSDVEALENAPASSARRAVIAEVIDSRPAEDQAAVRALAQELLGALKRSGNVGLEVGRLEALAAQFGDIAVTEGTGVRIGEVRLVGTFSTGNITVGEPSKKN
jgi:phage tail sheath protein FI